jgi:hypothetical protein
MKRSLTSAKDLSSICAENYLYDLAKEPAIESITRVTAGDVNSASLEICSNCRVISQQSVDGDAACERVQSLLPRKKCRIVSPELLPVHANFPIISPLESLDDLLLPPSSNRNPQRESVAKQFGSSLFDMGPATAALNDLELQALSHPFKAFLNISL